MRDSREGKGERRRGGGRTVTRDRNPTWKRGNWKGNSEQKKLCCAISLIIDCFYVCVGMCVLWFLSHPQSHTAATMHDWWSQLTHASPGLSVFKWGTPRFNCKGHIGNESWEKGDRGLESKESCGAVIQRTQTNMSVNQLCSVFVDSSCVYLRNLSLYLTPITKKKTETIKVYIVQHWL